MPRSPNEIGDRIVDEVSQPGLTPWKSFGKLGLMSVQAWADAWNGASVQLQLSHDKENFVDFDGAVFNEQERGLFGVPSGVYLRGVVVGSPIGLVVSAQPVNEF